MKSPESQTPTEAAEQMAVLKYLAHAYPKARVQHSPNEGKRGWMAQRALKTQGVSKGYPDLVIYHWQGARVLHLELKRTKGSRTSAEQKEWLEWLTQAGYEAHVCKGFDEARVVIDRFFAVRIETTERPMCGIGYGG